MQDDDLDQGLQKIKDILLRLENRSFDSELLKDFPIPPAPKKIEPVAQELPAPAPEEAPAPAAPEVPRLPEQPAGPVPAPEPEVQPEVLPGPPTVIVPAPEPEVPPEVLSEPPVVPVPAPEPEVQPEVFPEPPATPMQAPEPEIPPEVPSEPPALPAAPALPPVPEQPAAEPAPAAAPPVSIPEFLASLPAATAVPAYEESVPAGPAAQPEAQAPANPPTEAPAAKPAGSRLKKLALFCLGLALAGAVYQLVINGSAYRYRQASKLERVGDSTRALAAYEQLLSKHPESSETAGSWLGIGNIKAARGDRAGAAEAYEKFLALSRAEDPRIPEGKFKLAEVKFGAGDFFVAGNLYSAPDVRASAYAQKALERQGEIQQVEAQAAEAGKLAAKDPGKAAAAYSALLAVYPDFARAKAGLEEALRLQALPVKPRAAARPDAAAAAKAKLARSILMANRRQLGAPPAKAKPSKTFSLSQRYEACTPVWQAEKEQGKTPAAMAGAKSAYGCEALKDTVATCGKFKENARAIKAQSAEARAARMRDAVPGWTVEKQRSLDQKMLNLYEENRCAELLDLAAQSEEQEAPEGF